MKIRRTLEERMRLIEASGRGLFHEDAEEGQVLFSTDLKDGKLNLFVDGFSLEGRGTDKVLFSEVSSIDSHLKVEMFSGSSGSSDLDCYVPLDIKCGASSLSLLLPFLTYSSVMNILIGLRDDWLRKTSSNS